MLVDSSYFRGCINALVVGVCSHVAWTSGKVWLLPLALALVVGLRFARTWKEAALVSGVYFGVFWLPVIKGAQVFLAASSPAKGMLIWFAAISVCSLPFVVARLLPSKYYPLAICGAVMLHALSPVGLGSPMTAAGAFFPMAGFVGLVGLLLLIYSVISFDFFFTFVFTVAFVMFNLLPIIVLPETRLNTPPFSWTSFDTQGSRDSSHDMFTAFGMVGIAEHFSDSRVFIFPESMLREGSSLLEQPSYLEPLLLKLGAESKTIVFGTTVTLSRGRYENVLLIRGATTGEYRQRVPIPIGMWGAGYSPSWSSPGTVQIDDHRAAVLLCYEQQLLWPVIDSFREHPDVLVATSNLSWAKTTTIRRTQDTCVRAWARLFGVPYMMAHYE